jgi:hypothetical protein
MATRHGKEEGRPGFNNFNQTLYISNTRQFRDFPKNPQALLQGRALLLEEEK